MKIATIMLSDEEIRSIIAGAMREKYKETVYGSQIVIGISLSHKGPFQPISGWINAVAEIKTP